MKKAVLLTIIIGVAATISVRAQNDSASYDVAAADLEEAGMTDVVPVTPETDRFQEPVAYFRVNRDTEPERDDCDDCHDLAAVHVGESPLAPNWASGEDTIRRIGSRYQKRRYLADQQLVIIVTAPDPDATAELTDLLAAKFGT